MLLTPEKYWQAGTWHHFGGNDVILYKKTNIGSYKERQKWIRGTSDADGFFYLEHKVSGTYLTAQKDNVLKVNSKFEKISKYIYLHLTQSFLFCEFSFSAHRSRWSHHQKGKYQTLMWNKRSTIIKLSSFAFEQKLVEIKCLSFFDRSTLRTLQRIYLEENCHFVKSKLQQRMVNYKICTVWTVTDVPWYIPLKTGDNYQFSSPGIHIRPKIH